MTANRWTLVAWPRWDRPRPDPDTPGSQHVPGGLRIIPNGYPEGWTAWRARVESPPAWAPAGGFHTSKPGRIGVPPEPIKGYGPWEPMPWDRGRSVRRMMMLANATTDPAWTFDIDPAEWATATPQEIVGLLGELWGADDPRANARSGLPLAVVGLDEVATGTVEADGISLTNESGRRAARLLSRELAALVGDLRDALDLTPEGLAKLWTPADGWRTEDGMLWLEARMLAEIRQRLGVKALPDGVTDRYRERWSQDRESAPRLLRGWLDPARWDGESGSGWASPARWLTGLAKLLWTHRVRPAWERQLEAEERARKNAPGLPMPVHVDLGDSLVDAIHHAGRIVHKRDLTRQIPLRLAAVDAFALDALPLRALGKLTAHRLVRWMIRAAHEGHYLTIDRPVDLVDGVTARRGATGVDLVVVGGLSRLADVVGAGSKKATVDLRDALNVLSRVTLEWDAPGGEGGGSLVSWRGPGSRGGHAARGARAVVKITVSDVLCPGMGARLRGSSDALVVPILDVPAMPAGVSPRAHASIARFDWLVTREMVARAREAVGSGGVILNLDSIGRDAGLKRSHVAAAVDCWTADHDGAPARWDRNGSRYMLADRPPTADARRWILEGAAMRERRAKGGRVSGERRRAKLEGKAGRRK
jgi:hypothetical protein